MCAFRVSITIYSIPTITRSIGDYTRFNPFASIDENTDGFTISLAGQNNRYNAIYIDVAVNNDAFGLAGSGTNGGQTGVQPISIDAIEQFQIAIAPFDVRQSGFAGGAINAVTRSGTSEFEGSAYYFFRNEDLAGKTPTDNDNIERTQLSDFSAQTYGFRLGGPIIKNKLFFFVNAELQDDETPQPFDFADYTGGAEGNFNRIEQVINRVQDQFGYDVIDPNYTYILLASNTSEGYAFNVAASLTKPFENGFTGTLSYTYGDAYTVLDGTSSQNNSQWQGYHNVNGRNAVIDPQRSSFAAGHRVFGQFSYGVEYLEAMRSTLSLNLNAQTGGYYSYVIGAQNFLFIDDGGFGNNELIYVPANFEEALLVEAEIDGVTYTPEQQWELLDAFIEDDPHLSERRGQYVERNGGTIPWRFTLDLRFLQDFYIELANGKRNTLQLSIDIFNFTNLLNDEWGRVRFAGSFGNYPLVNLENVTLGNTTTPQYSINEDLIDGADPWDNIDDSGFRSSRWQMQIGLRYIFGGN